MPRNDADALKDWNDVYLLGNQFWSPFITEADRDIEFDLGKQWKASEEKYLKNLRREAAKYNKIRRINNLVSGYQRKNRLSLKVDPIEGSDTQTADDLSEVLQWVQQYGNCYNILSDAFRQGALVSGLNLIETYIDYTSDPASGDIRDKRMPHNRFLLDPSFTELDLSDCGWIITRDWLSPEKVKAILPRSRRKEIDLLKPKGPDNKFSNTMPYRAYRDTNMLRYDRFYRQEFKEFTMILDPKTGRRVEWDGPKKRLAEILRELPYLKTFEGMKRTVDLVVIVEDVVMYNGSEPTGIDDYPFTPVVGYYTPEYHLGSEYKLQGITRDMRDPQIQENKAKSQMHDIIESQINTGWKAKVGSVVDNAALYQAGQGQVVWINGENELTDVEQIQAREIPAGMFQLANLIGEDILSVSGVNLEMFGQAEDGGPETSGVLSKLRQSAGLVVLQPLFDNLRLSEKINGNRKIKMIQRNFSPEKVKRIINKEPSKEFYTRDFGKYDCVPTEGVLTDSQKQMNYLELKALRADGFPIPPSAILEASNIQNKEELIKIIQAEEKAQAKNAQMAQQLQQVQLMVLQGEVARLNAEVAESKANVIDKIGETKASQAQALLDQIKGIKELQDMDTQNVFRLIELLRDFKQREVVQ